MNLSGIVRKLIADDAAAFALIGNRVYPLHLPDNPTYPAVVVKMVNDQPSTNKTMTSPVDMISTEVVILAGTFQESCEARAAVRTAMDMFRGDVTFLAFTNPVDGIRFDGGSQDFVDVQAPTEQMRIYIHTDTYTIRLKMAGIVGGPGSNPGQLPYYDSDESAVSDGLAVGQEYLLNSVNIYGMPAGMRKIIQ